MERPYPIKMKEWREPGVRFIILRDNDGSDCLILKQRLVSKTPNPAPEYLVRIVCQEREIWFLGDLAAVAAAYPAAARQQQFKNLSRSDPDSLMNASDLIGYLTGTQTKIGRAGEIAKHMQPGKNRSTSFQVFVNGLSSFLST